MNLEKIKKLNIPKSPGVYKFFGKNKKIIYIGKAADLHARVSSYWRKSAAHTPIKKAMLEEIKSLEWIETDSEIEALLLEANLVKKYQPEYNILLRDDKRFVYIKVSTDDEVPGVFATRKIDRSGKYFGPFTSAEPVREALKALRKIWPYCAERKIKAKPCFYHQIGRCAGACGGIIGKKEYMEKVIKPIILFLEGKKGRLIKNYELKIKNYEKDLKKLDAGDEIYVETQNNINNLKYQILNFKKILEHTKVLSVAEKYANDAVELAKVLNLPRIPARIEGYDISNIFGKEAVGSMIVFSGGEPDKNEYRKFKIKINQGEANDVGMLKEVLERRFKHSLNNKSEILNLKSKINNWPLPDLIIIDGGKPQLNVVLRVLKNNKLDLPIIAISKGDGLRSAAAPDKLFFPGEKKPLELPLASPAIHLVKRVRDEAHRFAIEYHRKLKGRKLLNG